MRDFQGTHLHHSFHLCCPVPICLCCFHWKRFFDSRKLLEILDSLVELFKTDPIIWSRYYFNCFKRNSVYFYSVNKSKHFPVENCLVCRISRKKLRCMSRYEACKNAAPFNFSWTTIASVLFTFSPNHPDIIVCSLRYCFRPYILPLLSPSEQPVLNSDGDNGRNEKQKP